MTRLLRLLLRPRMQLRQCRGFVLDGQTHLGRLQVRIAGAAKPDVGLGIFLFRDDLGQGFARAFRADIDLGAGRTRINGTNHVAPLGLHGADDIDLIRRLGIETKQAGNDRGKGKTGQRLHETSLLIGYVT